MYKIEFRFDDGRDQRIDGYHANLRQAVAFALKTADRGGRPYRAFDRPRWVRVLDGDELVVAIEVIAGGLAQT